MKNYKSQGGHSKDRVKKALPPTSCVIHFFGAWKEPDPPFSPAARSRSCSFSLLLCRWRHLHPGTFHSRHSYTTRARVYFAYVLGFRSFREKQNGREREMLFARHSEKT